jgi:hypothetical protein
MVDRLGCCPHTAPGHPAARLTVPPTRGHSGGWRERVHKSARRPSTASDPRPSASVRRSTTLRRSLAEHHRHVEPFSRPVSSRQMTRFGGSGLRRNVLIGRLGSHAEQPRPSTRPSAEDQRREPTGRSVCRSGSAPRGVLRQPSGSLMKNVVPRPAPALVAATDPPIASTSDLVIASPNPLPPASRERDGSAR